MESGVELSWKFTWDVGMTEPEFLPDSSQKQELPSFHKI